MQVSRFLRTSRARTKFTQSENEMFRIFSQFCTSLCICFSFIITVCLLLSHSIIVFLTHCTTQSLSLIYLARLLLHWWFSRRISVSNAIQSVDCWLFCQPYWLSSYSTQRCGLNQNSLLPWRHHSHHRRALPFHGVLIFCSPRFHFSFLSMFVSSFHSLKGSVIFN